MNLTGIVAVSGKAGLYKLLARTKSGFVLEEINNSQNKVVVNLNTQKFTSLEDTTVYSTVEEEIKLSAIFEEIKNAGIEIPDTKVDSKKLRDFFLTVAPTHDEEMVYPSDIKKIISWYNLLKDLPLFNEEKAADTQNEVITP